MSEGAAGEPKSEDTALDNAAEGGAAQQQQEEEQEKKEEAVSEAQAEGEAGGADNSNNSNGDGDGDGDAKGEQQQQKQDEEEVAEGGGNDAETAGEEGGAEEAAEEASGGDGAGENTPQDGAESAEGGTQTEAGEGEAAVEETPPPAAVGGGETLVEYTTAYDQQQPVPSKPLSQVLADDPEVDLEVLLDLDDFITSLSGRNAELLHYLKQPGRTKKLIDFVVSPSPVLPVGTDASNISPELQELRRRSYVAYQALTTDLMTEVLIEDYALLDKLFSFLDHPSQNDALKNGYFSKVVLTIYDKFPAELFLYFSIKSHMVGKFVQNINNLFVMELLFKFIDSLSSHQWLADERLISQLVDLLNEEKYDVETQESAVRTLEIICNICSYCPYSVLVTQILETEEVTQKLLHYTLSESPTREFRIKQGLGIVIQVLNLLHKETDSFEFEEFAKSEEEADDADKEPPYFVQQFTARLPEFVEVLKTPSNRPAQRNAGSVIENPFGFTRLRVLEFVVGLIGTGFPAVTEKLEDLDVFSCCVDIFFSYRWNNFIHHQVYLLLSRILTAGNNFATVENVLRKSRFVERTLDAFDKYDPTTAGFFGHIVELCNEVLNTAAVSQKVAAYLEEFEEWNKFVNEKLDDINQVCNTGPSRFGDEEEDEDDFSYDPEQYYFGIPQLGGFEGEGEGDDEEDYQDGGSERLAELGKMLEEDVLINDDVLLDLELESDLRNLDVNGEEDDEDM